MNEKEISEIRRRIRPDKNNITHIIGCYVNEQKEIISEFNQSLAMMREAEVEKILTILKRTLSGTHEKNLVNISFDTKQVVNSEEHSLLAELKNSALKNADAVQTLFQKIIKTSVVEGNFLILLAHDTYDIPFYSADGQKQNDVSAEVFSYFLCCICPIKPTKSSLSYYITENTFHNQLSDQIISPPEFGFMFPAFDDRSTNIYNALYYSRNITENHKEFVDAVFNTEIPMPATVQKEIFQSILGDTLAEECSYDVVQTVHEQLCELISDHKVSKEVEPLSISKNTIKNVLKSCGVSDSNLIAFEEKYDSEFGSDTELSPKNIVDTKQFEIRTPNVNIQVAPEHSSLIETRIIDGIKYIVIRANESIEVNGVAVVVSKSE